jgi:tRNA(Ile)-lysidine synthase
MASSLLRRIESRVLRFVQEEGAILPQERVLVAISGGPDSTALLLVLSSLRQALGLTLWAAYFDHRLRPPQDVADDIAYCRDLCHSLAVPLATGEGDVRAHARAHRLSLEEAARQLRYRFLKEEAVRVGAQVVAVGHTRTDQAETVLLHLVRGTGIDGLAAMRPRSPWPLGEGPALVRPLLVLSREDTEAYCREAGLSPRRDPTNEQLAPLRNRIRHRVMPVLRQLNPRVEEALCRVARAAAQMVDLLDAEAEAAWGRLAHVRPEGVALNREGLLALPSAVAGRLLVRAHRLLLPGGQGLSSYHWQTGLALARRGRGRLNLPGRLVLQVGPQEVWVGRPPPTLPPLAETPLRVPGVTEVGGWRFRSAIVVPPPRPPVGGPLEAYLDLDALGSPLIITSRRPGDRIRPLGLKGEKKVQDLLVDAKVPAFLRDGIPILRCPWGIAWVVGLRLDERAALTPRSRRALHLRAEPPPGFSLPVRPPPK